MANITYQVYQKPIEERIIDAACIYWGVEREYFVNQQKKVDSCIAYRKGIVYYLIKQHTQYSYQFIAEKFSFLAHMPVSRLVHNIESTKGVYKQTVNDINQIWHLADKLDAAFITTSVMLVNNTLQTNPQ